MKIYERLILDFNIGGKLFAISDSFTLSETITKNIVKDFIHLMTSSLLMNFGKLMRMIFSLTTEV